MTPMPEAAENVIAVPDPLGQMQPPSPRDLVLTYAQPQRPPGRLAAGVFIMLAGLALVGLGGCFLIGVLLIYKPALAAFGPATPITAGTNVLIGILYLLAFACFGGALLLIITATRVLLAIAGVRA